MPFESVLTLSDDILGGGGGMVIDLAKATLSARTLPAHISRRRLLDGPTGRCWRICCFKERVVVDPGARIVRTKSGNEVVKRITRSKGLSDGLSAMLAVAQEHAGERSWGYLKAHQDSDGQTINVVGPSIVPNMRWSASIDVEQIDVF